MKLSPFCKALQGNHISIDFKRAAMHVIIVGDMLPKTKLKYGTTL